MISWEPIRVACISVSVCISLYLSVSVCITLYLFISCVCLCISLYLFVSLCVSLYLSVSLCISLYLFVSLCISVYLFVSLCICLYFVFAQIPRKINEFCMLWLRFPSRVRYFDRSSLLRGVTVFFTLTLLSSSNVEFS